MIISASRRTDIPAFYAGWLINRIREGYCTVPNPFNANQVSEVSLQPQNVDALVFWTRNPRPLFPFLAELDERGYRYLFNFTLLNNPRQLDAHGPNVKSSIRIFRELCERIGPERILWRYDPIVCSNRTDASFHRRTFEQLAGELKDHTKRCTVSLVQVYRKAARRLRDLAAQGIELHEWTGSEITALMQSLSDTAKRCGMELFSCAQETDFSAHGIKPGKCIDADYISKIFEIRLSDKKDPAQRSHCGCSVSKDIGMYDSCLFGCRYCYATGSFERSRMNYRKHRVESPSLLGWYLPQRDRVQSQLDIDVGSRLAASHKRLL